MELLDYIIIGDQEELRNYKRDLDFTENSRIESMYHGLPVEFQEIVTKMICTLDGDENKVGYNLKQVLNWIKSSEVESDRIKLRDVYRTIVEAGGYIDIGELIFVDESDEEISEKEFLELQIAKLEHALDKKKRNKKIREQALENTAIKALCDMYMVSPNLVYEGEGEVYLVNERYLQDKVLKELRSKMKFNKEQIWSTKRFFDKCQQIIDELNPNGEKVYEVKYARIKKHGGYEFLREPMKTAVNDLIEDLYNLDVDIRDQFVFQKYVEMETDDKNKGGKK